MTESEKQKLGKTLWDIADQLRGSMNADDFRDYMLALLFLRYLSDNYESAAQRLLGADYPTPLAPPKEGESGTARPSPLAIWYDQNPSDAVEFEKQMRRRVHYVIQPQFLWTNIAELARTQDPELLTTLEAGLKYIENESFENAFRGLFSEIHLTSDKLGKTYTARNAKLCGIITAIATGLREFSTDADTLGDAYEY